METKIFRMAIKDLSDEGQFQGYLSVFGNVDHGGDLVEAGAFSKTLQENKAFPLLWAHSSQEPHLVVGTFHGKEDKRGLLIDGEFFRDLDGGKQAYDVVKKLYEKRVKVGLSIGYKAIQWDMDKDDTQPVRRLKEIQLYEGSLTLFPMNDQALVQAVKEGLEQKPYSMVRVVCPSCSETVMEIYDPVSEKAEALESKEPAKDAIPEDKPPIVEDIAANRWYLDLEKKVRDLKSI